MSEIINEIIKKPRKPRMSTIVSKAVLLKQLSSSNIIIQTKEVEETKFRPEEETKFRLEEETKFRLEEETKFRPEEEWSLDLSCPPSIEKNNVELINQFPILCNKIKEETVSVVDVVEPIKKLRGNSGRKIPAHEIDTEITFVGRCDICDVDFKSEVLFSRHDSTFRHKHNTFKREHVSGLPQP